MARRAFILAFFLPFGHIFADPIYPFSGPSEPVTLEDILPHYERSECKKNEFYSEWWSFIFSLDNKYGAYVQFLLSNLGQGDGKAYVRAHFSTPEGQNIQKKDEFSVKDWSFEKDRFSIKIGENSVSGDLQGFVLKVKNESFEAEFDVKPVVPPYKPGNGRVQYGSSKDRYYEYHVIAPVAEVSGKVKIKGEDAERTVSGLMFVEHVATTLGMHEQARQWVRFRSFKKDRVFLFSQILPPPEYGNDPVRFVVLFEKGQKVFEALNGDVSVRLASFKADEEKEGYAVPWVLEISGISGKGKNRFGIKAKVMTDREDYLEEVSTATRFILSKFAKPVLYSFDAIFAGEIEVDGRIRKIGGFGRYYFTIVNP